MLVVGTHDPALTLWDMMGGLTHSSQSSACTVSLDGLSVQQCVCRKVDTEKEIDLDESKL